MRQLRSEAAALAKANFWLRVEHALLELAFAFRQLEDAFVEASLQKKGLLTVWKLWRELRREHHVSVRLLRLGWRLLPQDAAGIANAGQTWKSGEPPGDLQAELLDRRTRFSPVSRVEPGEDATRRKRVRSNPREPASGAAGEADKCGQASSGLILPGGRP